jgi:hypothetical protein
MKTTNSSFVVPAFVATTAEKAVLRRTEILTILVLVLASMASGAQKLTVNGQDVSSIIIKVGQSCTVEVVSDNEDSYADFLGFDDYQSWVLGYLWHIETKPEAGNKASVALVNEPTFYGYSVWARSWPTGHPFPGVHFVFGYTAQELGQTVLKLYDQTRTILLDSVSITTVHSESGTAFTYQGRLINSDNPAEGLYDFRFALYDSPDVNLGTQLGGTICVNELDVIDGYFTTPLDFGSDVFDGSARWLEIAVKSSDSNDPNAYTLLEPRQQITPTLYAFYAEKAGTVSGGIGNKNPAAKLQVNGDDSLGWGSRGCLSSDQGASIELGGRGVPYIDFSNDTTSDYDMRIILWGNDVLDIEGGNVGIGTTSPKGKLDVVTGGINDTFTVNAGSPNVGVELRSGTTLGTPYIDFSNDVTTDYDMRIILQGDDVLDIEGGNVGIGTTNPGANKLEVTGGPIKATGGLIIETRTSDPPSPVTGRMWLRTDL